MNQKQYHSLEELPLMMNIAMLPPSSASPEPELTNSPMTAVSPHFRLANGLSFHARNSSIGWIGSVRSKNAPNGKLDLLFGCACGNRVC